MKFYHHRKTDLIIKRNIDSTNALLKITTIAQYQNLVYKTKKSKLKLSLCNNYLLYNCN